MKQLLFCIFLLLLEGCSSNQPPAVSGQIDELPTIYPDYIDVTILGSQSDRRILPRTGNILHFLHKSDRSVPYFDAHPML